MPRSLRLEFPGAYYHVMAREWGQITRINIKEGKMGSGENGVRVQILTKSAAFLAIPVNGVRVHGLTLRKQFVNPFTLTPPTWVHGKTTSRKPSDPRNFRTADRGSSLSPVLSFSKYRGDKREMGSGKAPG
jgi:hypothetical protein